MFLQTEGSYQNGGLSVSILGQILAQQGECFTLSLACGQLGPQILAVVAWCGSLLLLFFNTEVPKSLAVISLHSRRGSRSSQQNYKN